MAEAAKEVVLVHESLAQSIVKDVVSCVTLIGTVGLGVWLDSAPLQWLAGTIWIIWFIGKGFNNIKNQTYSFDAARKRIDEIEAGTK